MNGCWIRELHYNSVPIILARIEGMEVVGLPMHEEMKQTFSNGNVQILEALQFGIKEFDEVAIAMNAEEPEWWYSFEDSREDLERLCSNKYARHKIKLEAQCRLLALEAREREKRIAKTKGIRWTWEEERKRIGHIYIIHSLDDASRFYKIGMTEGNKQRPRQVMSSLPFACELWAYFKVGCVHSVERFLHARFAQKRRKGEWFELDEDDLVWIRAYISRMELDVEKQEL